jgi:hypothetical protein
MSNLLNSLTAKQLHRAASIRERIEALEKQLNGILNGSSASARTALQESGPATVGKKRTMSAAAKARIAEAQRRRWAKVKAAKK